jgi:chromosome segregation ATPase
MLESHADVWREFNLGVLREEMQMIVDPPKKAPTYVFECRQETPTTGDTTADPTSATMDRVAKLDQVLEQQTYEEEKWTELSRKLEKKNSQEDNEIIRLTTSLKVFRDELATRTNHLATLTEMLHDKKKRAQLQIDKLRNDQAHQRDQAERSKETAEKADEVLEEKTDEKAELEETLKTAYRSLKPLEERVQNLEVNLYGNNKSLSGTQREYMKAELQVERDHRDRVRARISDTVSELEDLNKELISLQAKGSLFRDEHARRTLRAESLETKVQEQEAFFAEQLKQFVETVETVRKDRDAWETKTLSLAESLHEKSTESAKLKVKLQLFHGQLNAVRSNVHRLNAMKEASRESSSRSISSAHREEPELVKETPENVAGVKDTKSSYIWIPPKQQEKLTLTVTKQVEELKSTKTIPYSAPVCKPPVTSDVFGGGDVIKINHVSVKFDKPIVSTPGTTSQMQKEPTKTSSKDGDFNLSATLEDLRRDLAHQKRFQQEHAVKMEQQYARLASKVEGLSGDDGLDLAAKSFDYSPTDSQLQALKVQIQKEAMRDSHDMRQLLQQMNQRCDNLDTKLEGLREEAKERDDQAIRLEEKLKAKESQYFEQMEFLRGEMERQLERQQQIFADKISQAMLQMERLVSTDRITSKRSSISGHDSMASLESLPPMEQDNTAGAGAYSMTSGIKVFGGPLFRK